MIIDTARVVGSGSPYLTVHLCSVHRPSLESEL
jgi:hypothetical protein